MYRWHPVSPHPESASCTLVFVRRAGYTWYEPSKQLTQPVNVVITVTVVQYLLTATVITVTCKTHDNDLKPPVKGTAV